VGFFDADLSVANNSSFLRLMELGRLDLMARSGFLKHVVRNKWALPLASAHVLFRRPLKRWQRFTLKTRVICWQQEWVFIEHIMESKGKVVGKAIMKSALIENRQKHLLEHVFLRACLETVSPPMSSEAALYENFEAALRAGN
jgi:acyl-CoA thioesterase FadM